MASLEADKQFIQFMSIADSSRRVYNHGQNCYLSLCNQLRIPPYPLIERNLTLFTTFLARSTGFSTIRTYLAAVRFRNIELGFSTNFEHMHQLNMILRGIKRLKGASCRPKRLPITPEIMRILKPVSDPALTNCKINPCYGPPSPQHSLGFSDHQNFVVSANIHSIVIRPYY